MPIRSMPHDVPLKEGQDKSEQDTTPTTIPTKGGTLHSTGDHKIHERKEEWLKKIEPFLNDEVDPEDEIRKNNEKARSHPWLAFMIVAIVTSLIMFMMIPILDNFYTIDGPNNPLESLKEFISFVAPIIIIMAAIAGTAGYFRLFYSAIGLIIGHVAGLSMFVLSLNTINQSYNLGVYWIILLSFVGGSIGFLLQLIWMLRKKIHRELSPLMFIGFASFAAGVFIILQFAVSYEVNLVTYIQASERVEYQIYEPAYLPEKIVIYGPKLFINDGTVSVYYGNDYYPPPPIIDFLSGIEIIQSQSVMDINTVDPEPGVVFIDIGDETARFTQRRGRATIEWNQEDTHIVLNIYSNITAREMFKIARAMQPALTLSE